MKTLLAIPNSRYVDNECFASVYEISKVGRVDLYLPASYSIDLSRCDIAKHALDNGYDYILWIDSDTTIPKNTLKRLMSHGKDIVSGVYTYKVLGGKNAVAKRFIPNEVDTYEDIPIEDIQVHDDIFEVDGIGFGCVLTKTEIFKHIHDPWFVLTKNMGEDIDFCRKAQNAGYKIYIDPKVLAGHIGKILYNIKGVKK